MVALQIRGVSEPTRRTLSAEAKARGESQRNISSICWIARRVTSTTVDPLRSSLPTHWWLPGRSSLRS